MNQELRCYRHPERATVLRCGKCERPICLECTIVTPVGARCRDCAQLRPLPTYDVRAEHYAKSSVTGVFMGCGVAVLFFVVLREVPFSLWLAPVVAGYAVGETVHRTANRKRGRGLRLVAVLALSLTALFGEFLYLDLSGWLASPGLVVFRLANDLLRLLLYLALGSYLAVTRL